MRREGNSINKICASLSVSKDTVRKVIREKDVEYIPKQYQHKVGCNNKFIVFNSLERCGIAAIYIRY